GGVRDWRDDVGCLALKMRIPKFLRVERPARIEPFHELITDPPANVAAFNHVNPAGLVATVRIVVAGKQVSVWIENEVLRVAQAEREHLEVGTVRIAAENAACVRFADLPAIGQLHVRAAVADAEINLSVRTEMHAVRIVADETNPHAKSVMQRLAEISDAIAVGVAQQPEIRDVRVPHSPLARQDAGPDALQRSVE